MTLDEIIKYFKNPSVAARKLNLRKQNITNWRNAGRVPLIHQLRLEQMTNGELKADLSDLDNRYKKGEPNVN